MSSAGHYHITRNGIQRHMHERFIFISEKDSQDYLSLILTSNDTNDQTSQKNTRLDIRKTSKNRTRKTLIFKDNTKKDPYPWLDDNDPRRHMTKNYLKTQYSCLKPVLQKGKDNYV